MQADPRSRALALAALGPLTLASVVGAGSRVEVSVSVAPLAQLVERIGGDDVRVTVLLPSGAAPETWSPTPREVLDLARADLYVSVGHPTLAAERRFAEAVATPAAALVRISMSELAPPLAGSDPHLWVDLEAMMATAREVASWLGGQLPPRHDEIDRRLAALLLDVERLDGRMGRLLAGARRPVLVQHPSWERLLERYGVESLVVEDDGKDPSPLRIVELVRRSRELGVETVFTQPGVSDRGARLVAKEIGAEVVELDVLAPDWLENLQRAAEAFAHATR